MPCIQLDLFEVTLKGKTVEATATAAGGTSYTILDCTDQSDWLAPDEDIYGVPAYTYSWSPIGATDDSIYVTFPLGTTSYTLTITDACGNIATDVVTVTNNCILLPLPLTEFSGYHQNDFNLLNWSTQSEIGTNYIIERSVTGNDFIPIGTVESKSNTGFQTYSFSDLSPDNQIVYYRLKQINTKNEVLYSDVIAIKTAYKPGYEIISTNFDAENNMLQLSINSEKDLTADMIIYDLAGKIVFTNSIALATGTTVVKSTLPELAKGAYVVHIVVEDQNLESKFVN
ncbi:MAG TPA: T9SS type A sorting domain-containing protein [Chitinophagales bacterium]|nr:T9SS type A sorting domain-containing protein [Chitinophagales bacterium]